MVMAKTLSERFSDFVRDSCMNKNASDEMFLLGKISVEAANKVRAANGRNVQGYKLLVEAGYVRHVKNRHPEVVLYDWLLLGKILSDADKVEASVSDEDAIIFKKRIAYQYICVKLIVDKDRALYLRSFRVHRKMDNVRARSIKQRKG